MTRLYVIRVEQYLKALSGKRLANHSAKDVTDYLEAQSRNTKIKDWQFLQIVDAIQNLFTMLEVLWLNEVVHKSGNIILFNASVKQYYIP